VNGDRGAKGPRARMSLALQAQLHGRRGALDSGAARVGWKVGLHIAEVEEVMGSEPVFGYLTSATRLESGGAFHVCGVGELRAESEVAVELGRDVHPTDSPEAVRAAIAGLAAALELVDVDPPVEGFEGVVADNVYHRGFALGPTRRVASGRRLASTCRVNGELRASGTTSEDFVAKLTTIARQLAAVGEALRAGDRIITGSLTHIPIGVGDAVEIAIAPLGSLSIEIVD
jgi:2-oxo-3-hexenedioate decarboxylase